MAQQRDPEVVYGGPGGNGKKKKERNPGITPIERWEQDFENLPFGNDIEKILEFPGVDDMAGVLARGNFKSEHQRIAAVRLAYKNRKFHDNNHQMMLRDNVASTLGAQALGKILQIQTGTNLMVPGVLREILGMKQVKPGNEDIKRGSDFRPKREDLGENVQGDR